jgi:hypothetical protein
MVRAGIIHVSFARVKVVIWVSPLISEKASVEDTFVKVCIARYKVLPPLILIIAKRPVQCPEAVTTRSTALLLLEVPRKPDLGRMQ